MCQLLFSLIFFDVIYLMLKSLITLDHLGTSFFILLEKFYDVNDEKIS